MGKFAIVENGKIVNMIIADQTFVDEQGMDAIDVTAMNPQPHIGYVVVDGAIQFPSAFDLEEKVSTSSLSPEVKDALLSKITNSEPFTSEDLVLLKSVL